MMLLKKRFITVKKMKVIFESCVFSIDAQL